MVQLDTDQLPEISLQEDGDPMASPSSSAPNEESEILPAQAYTDPTESLPSIAATLLPNQVPEFPIQMYTDPTELPPIPVPNQVPDYSLVSQGPEELPPTLEPNNFADAACWSSRIAERTRNITELHWGNSHLQDGIPRSDSGGGGYRSEDEEDANLMMTGNEDSDDDDEDSEEEEEEDLFAESDVTGIFAWDLLGESFEHEVASIGMFLAHESSVLLTIV